MEKIQVYVCELCCILQHISNLTFYVLLGLYNDLWKYTVNNNTWTWISGGEPVVYGEKGIPSPDNYPGARESAVGWFDSLRQELWLFGGFGYINETARGA